MLIKLCVACIICSFIGICVKWMYKPPFRVKNFLVTMFLFLALASQLGFIYLISMKSSFLGAVAIIIFDHYWFYFKPFHPNSDPAGNGMARAFRPFYIMVSSVILSLISFLFIKFIRVDGNPIGLYIVLFVAAIIGFVNIMANRQSYLSGDEFYDRARWAKLRVEDYRKSMFRDLMLERNDEWEGKELDAVPKELTHWDVYGCNDIHVKTFKQMCCFLLEGTFTFSTDDSDSDDTSGSTSTSKIHCYGLLRGCLGYAKNCGESSLVPCHVVLAWYDLSDGKTYKIDTDLPDTLNHYFDDKDRFRDDNIEFRLLPHGKAVMFHNWHNQIHNIMLDYPLMGEETKEYEEKVAEFLKNKGRYVMAHARIGDEIGEEKGLPSLDTINKYLERFPYTILFRSKNNFNITKTICRFFNGEKILSGGEWEEETDPARLKDVFLRFEDEKEKYSCFVYFSEEEILRVFNEAFGHRKEPAKAEFVIQVGIEKSAFAFEIKIGDQSYPLRETEIRLYRNDEDDGGKLVFKSYNGIHRNLLRGASYGRENGEG